MKRIYQYMAIFFNFSPASYHLHPLQVENWDSNSRLVVDEMTMANPGLKGLNSFYQHGKTLLWGIKWVFKHPDLGKFGLKLNRYE